MCKQYKSEILAAVHETALGLHEAGVLNKATMKTFGEMCLTPVGIHILSKLLTVLTGPDLVDAIYMDADSDEALEES